ncbi:NADH-ubiquinone oxidoreductase-F iron-sulfur binding region domain-containing protein [Thermodesulfobacteriota bacterium]
MKVIDEAFRAIRERAEAEVRAQRDPARPVICVGTATCGRAAGSLAVLDAIENELAAQGLDARITQTGCLGHCYAEPMLTISKPGFPPILYGHVHPGSAALIVRNFIGGDDPCYEYILGALEESGLVPSVRDLTRFAREHKVILGRCGVIDPESIASCIDSGGYTGMAAALAWSPESIIEEVRASGLRGLGGAGFPTGRKWALCREAAGELKYVVCNADEGDPGAFMDRALLESDPHAVIEGMIICGHAIGSYEGMVYVRHEYPLAVEMLREAIEQAGAWGLLGDDILGSGHAFRIEIIEGAGAFVCGESSALMYSIEGGRGMPRVRPPHSIAHGLWGRPTVLNNVKTFANIPAIIDEGHEKFRSIGTETSAGTAVFALAGKVLNTGLVEVPMGTSLREVIFDIGGGVPNKRHFKAVQIGGPSGGCLPASQLDTPVDFDALDAAGAMMGSGGMVILDEYNCMVETARYFLEFTEKESCGKCPFCRVGTRHMLNFLEEFVRGRGRIEDLALLEELALEIRDGSLCSLGRTAPNPVLTTLRYFRSEYEAHILEGRCPGLVCTALTTFYIVSEKCELSCEACVGSCPVEAVYTGPKRWKVVDQEKCIKCGSCRDACPPQYAAVIKVSPTSLVPPEGERRGSR